MKYKKFQTNPFLSTIKSRYNSVVRKIMKQRKREDSKRLFKYFQNLSYEILKKLSSAFIQGLVSLLAVTGYILSTYYPDDHKTNDPFDLKVIKAMNIFEIIVTAFIIVFLFIDFIHFKNKATFFFKPLNLLDLATIVSQILRWISLTSESFGFTRIFRLIRILRVVRIAESIGKNREKNKNPRKKLFFIILKIISYILAFIFISTGIIYFLHQNYESFRLVVATNQSINCMNDRLNETLIAVNTNEFNFSLICETEIKINMQEINLLTVFYYVMITITTVGYGDIYHVYTSGRILMGLFFIIAIIFITSQSDELSNITKYFDVYITKSLKTQHLIISGFLNEFNLVNVLDTIFKGEYQHIPKKIIIVQNNFDEKMIESIITKPCYNDEVDYIRGDITISKTMEQCDLVNSDCVFILCDQTQISALNKSDYYVAFVNKVLTEKSVKRMYSQLFSESMFSLNFINESCSVSIKKLKMHLMINNFFFPGLIVLFMNLMWNQDLTNYLKHFDNYPWMVEYSSGIQQKMKTLKIKNLNLIGKSFISLVRYSLTNHNLLVIGVKHRYYLKGEKTVYNDEILINPTNYTIREDDEVFGFINEFSSIEFLSNQECISSVESDKSCENFFELKKETKEIVSKHERKSMLMTSAIDRSVIEIILEKRFFLENEIGKLKQMKSILIKHLLVFIDFNDINDFINTFPGRIKNYIFFVCENFDLNKWNSLKTHSQLIYCIELFNVNLKNLKLLKIKKSKHVFLFSRRNEGTKSYDFSNISVVKIMEEKYELNNYTIELFDKENFAHLSNNNEILENNFLKRLPQCFWPQYMDSKVLFNYCFDSLLIFSYFQDKNFLNLFQKLFRIDDNPFQTRENLKYSFLKYVKTEQILYDELFTIITNHFDQLIPIGLRRNSNNLQLNKNIPYIITNPKKEIIVFQGDEIICIGTTESLVKNIPETNEESKLEENSYSSSNDDEHVSYGKLNNSLHSFLKRKSKIIDSDEMNDEDFFTAFGSTLAQYREEMKKEFNKHLYDRSMMISQEFQKNYNYMEDPSELTIASKYFNISPNKLEYKRSYMPVKKKEKTNIIKERKYSDNNYFRINNNDLDLISNFQYELGEEKKIDMNEDSV